MDVAWVDPTEDNMLKITGDGRRGALDLRLVGESPDPSGGKLAESLAGKLVRTRRWNGPAG